MHRWIFALAVGTSSFLAGTFFEVTGESSRKTIELDKVGRTAFCRVVSDAKNIAGLTQADLEQRNYLQTARRMVIFKKMFPEARRLLVLYSESSQGAPITAVRGAAERLGIELVERRVNSAVELDAALRRTKIDEVDGIFHIPDDWVDRHADLIFETARMKGLPAMTFSKNHIDLGALVSYGTEIYQCELRRGLRTDRISTVGSATAMTLKLIKRPFLEINLKTAAEIGLPIPAKALQRADKVIQ